MKYSCDIIRDLLPLYIDDVASPPSRQMVEEHLSECVDCRNILIRMQNDETENMITVERENVIAGQREFFERKSAVIGCVLTGIFMIPVLICLFTALTTGAGLGWFFVVLSSLLVAASLSIVPLMVPDNKGLWTFGSFTASLILLLGVCCLHTGGNWFFVAATSVLFGLSLILLPFVLKNRILAEHLGNRKGLVIMAADTLLYMVMMLTIGLHTKTPGFFRTMTAVSVPCILLAWALFFIIRNRMEIQTKQHFPAGSEDEVSDLPEDKMQTQLLCYGERIDKRDLGKADQPDRHLQIWEVVLLVLGSPLWIVLLITSIAVLLSVYVVVWAVIAALWAVEVSFIAGSFGSIVMSIWKLFQGNGLQSIVMICAGAILAGLSIFLFFGCKAATKSTVVLTGKIAMKVKSLFQKRLVL